MPRISIEIHETIEFHVPLMEPHEFLKTIETGVKFRQTVLQANLTAGRVVYGFRTQRRASLSVI